MKNKNKKKHSKKAVVAKPAKEVYWGIHTSIAEDKETGLLSVMKFNHKTSATKLVLDKVVIPYIPTTLSEVISLALQQEISSAAEELMEFFSSFESIEEAENALKNAPATETQVTDWVKSIDLNDLVIWVDFYGQTGFSEEDFIEVKRFYQLEQEAEEQIIDFIETEGENSNE